MKISNIASIVAGAIAALSIPFMSNQDFRTARPPYDPDPDPIETPTPFPTPTPVPAYTGTVGMNLPVIYEDWWLRNGDKFAVLSGPSVMENAYFRTNILMTWKGQIKFDMIFLSKEGVQLGSKSFDTYVLEPCAEGTCSGYFQLNSPMKEINLAYEDVFAVRCVPTGGTGQILFFVTSIDNKSGDPTMYSQFRFASNGDVWSESGKYN